MAGRIRGKRLRSLSFNPRERRLGLRLLALLALISGSAAAQTLAVRINDSGQQACFSLGQTTACDSNDWPLQDATRGRDAAAAAGTLQKTGAGSAGFDFTKVSGAGVDLPASAVLGSGRNDWVCTRDNVTGLLWRAARISAVSAAGARHAALGANAATLCNRRDWRVPETAELQGLVDYDRADPAIDGDYFPQTAAGFQWSSEADPDHPALRQRAVNFSGGFVNAIPARIAADARLVAGGEAFAGRADNGDGTVTDPRTGLMWERCSQGQDALSCAGDVEAPDWHGALHAAADAAAQGRHGYTGWRLPNVKELAGLLDARQGRPAIDVSGFPNTPDAAYWTATTDAKEPGMAWAVFFGNASVFAVDKSTAARVRLVRSAAAAFAGERPDRLFEDAFDLVDAPPVAPGVTLASITIDTGGQTIDRDVYVAASIAVSSPDSTQDYVGTMMIKGRGNSTWGMPKKPYRLKLDQKAALLGMPQDKNWVLLANYDDKSLLRNHVAYALGDRLAMAWSPRSRFAEVILNGEYVGVYQLAESIRVTPDRVDIAELESGDIGPDVISGGYLLELDNRRDCASSVQFDTARGVPYCIDTPDEDDIAPEQYAYIRDYMQAMEDSIYAPDFADPVTGYAAYLEPSSFIDFYLVNELFKNVDARDFSSIWQYKDRNGKLNRGPLWDFDISSGNMNYGPGPDPRGFWIRDGTYYNGLFQDPAFAAATRARWDALKAAQIDTLPAFVEATAAALGAAPAENFRKWPILDRYTWPNGVVTGSYEGDVAYFKDWLLQRIAWLDANL